MAVFTAETKNAWQAVIDKAQEQRPSVGKVVTIDKGKYKEQSGTVTWHGRDAYSSLWRYGSGAQDAMREVIGRDGYRIRVQPQNGVAFFCKAEYAHVHH